jgi:hypothetical protein
VVLGGGGSDARSKRRVVYCARKQRKAGRLQAGARSRGKESRVARWAMTPLIKINIRNIELKFVM